MKMSRVCIYFSGLGEHYNDMKLQKCPVGCETLPNVSMPVSR